MKKILFLLLFSCLAFGQNKATDTLTVNGTQPATILKIGNNKIYIAQNKEKVTPYILQKDGSFLSSGVPFVKVNITKSQNKIPAKFVINQYENEKLKDFETKEILTIDDRKVYIKKSVIKNSLFVMAYYPLNKELLSVRMSVEFTDKDDELEKFYQMRDILEKGVLIMEDYYVYRKE